MPKDRDIHGDLVDGAVEQLLLLVDDQGARVFAMKLKPVENRFSKAKAIEGSGELLTAVIIDEKGAGLAKADGWATVLEFRGLDHAVDGFVAHHTLVEVSHGDHYLPLAGELCDPKLLDDFRENAQKMCGWTIQGGQLRPPPAVAGQASKIVSPGSGYTPHINADGSATLRDARGMTLGQDPNAARFVQGFMETTVTGRQENSGNATNTFKHIPANNAKTKTPMAFAQPLTLQQVNKSKWMRKVGQGIPHRPVDDAGEGSTVGQPQKRKADEAEEAEAVGSETKKAKLDGPQDDKGEQHKTNELAIKDTAEQQPPQLTEGEKVDSNIDDGVEPEEPADEEKVRLFGMFGHSKSKSKKRGR